MLQDWGTVFGCLVLIVKDGVCRCQTLHSNPAVKTRSTMEKNNSKSHESSSMQLLARNIAKYRL